MILCLTKEYVESGKHNFRIEVPGVGRFVQWRHWLSLTINHLLNIHLGKSVPINADNNGKPKHLKSLQHMNQKNNHESGHVQSRL